MAGKVFSHQKRKRNQNMDSEGIKNAMSGLIQYFKASLSDEAKHQYLKQIGYIPKVAIDEIAELIVAERRPTPANFPTIQEIKGKWYQWQKDHPDKVDRRAKAIIPCDSCRGSGLLHFRGLMPCSDDGKPYWIKPQEVAAWCGDCENWKRHANSIEGDRRYTKQYIIDKGWSLWPYNKHPKIKGGIKDMANAIGKPVEKLSDDEWNKRVSELKKQATEIAPKEYEGVDDIPF